MSHSKVYVLYSFNRVKMSLLSRYCTVFSVLSRAKQLLLYVIRLRDVRGWWSPLISTCTHDALYNETVNTLYMANGHT